MSDDFKKLFEERKAALLAKKLGESGIQEPVVEVPTFTKSSTFINSGDSFHLDNAKKLLKYLGITSVILNVVALTIIGDWFNFMGSVEYAVWKMNNVKGAIVKDAPKQKLLYKNKLIHSLSQANKLN